MVERFGDYELTERIAVGGMAEIFLARRRGPSGFAKRVALKRILPDLAKRGEFRQMFADEARLCASLSHPGLVQVFDYGEVDGTPFLVMEWVDGPDLAALIASGGPMPPEPAAFMMSEIARTLTYVHDAHDESGKSLGVVHRDLSPGNILISRAGDVKLGDFGVAKARGRMARTEAGQLKGTLSYLAPEQVSGGSVDKRTDVYALGLLLFEVLTGERYVQGDNEIELLKEAANPARRSARSLCPSLPIEFERVLERALVIEPAERYPSAAAIELDLRRLVPDAAKARALLEKRVADATGKEGRRRQTEMVSNDTRPRRFAIPKKPATVIALVVICAVGAVALLVKGSDDEGRSIAAIHRPPVTLDAGPVEPRGPSPEVDASTSPQPAAPDAGVAERASNDAADQRPSPKAPVKRPQPEQQLPMKNSSHGDRGDATRPGMEPGEGEEREQPRSPGPDLSALLRAADQRRRGRGLVAGDDPELDGLRRRAAALISSGDAEGGQVAAAIAAYERRIDVVDINFEFINRKLRRVDRRIRTLDQDSPLARELTALSRQALGRAMSGDYDGANALLNRLLDRLPR